MQQVIGDFNAKQQFYASTLSMSWQMALSVIILVVGGIKLDEHFNTSPSFTLAGFFLAAGAACMVVWNTVKGVNRQQAQQDMKVNKRNKRAQ